MVAGYDAYMAEFERATEMRQFLCGERFNEEFAAWKAEVEANRFTLVMVREEPIVGADGATLGFTVWYRLEPRKYVAKRRY